MGFLYRGGDQRVTWRRATTGTKAIEETACQSVKKTGKTGYNISVDRSAKKLASASR